VRNHQLDSDNAAIAEKFGREQDLKSSLREDQDRSLWRIAKEGQTKTNKFAIGMQGDRETALNSFNDNVSIPQGRQHQIDLMLPHQQVYDETIEESALSRGQRPPLFIPDYVNNDFFAEENFLKQPQAHRVFDAAGNDVFVGSSSKFSFPSTFFFSTGIVCCSFISFFLFLYHYSPQTHREPLLTERSSLV